MKKLKTNTFFKFLVVFFTVTYLLALFTNMFCIPRYTAAYSKTQDVSHLGNNKFIKSSRLDAVNFLQVVDRSTFDNDKHDVLRFISEISLLLFIGFGFFIAKAVSLPVQSRLFYNLKYSYLSFCVFRI